MKNIVMVSHKYAPHKLYVKTHMERRDISFLAVAFEVLHFESQNGDLGGDCIAAPELCYLLTSYFGCQVVSRQRWLKISARRRKAIDIYHNGEGHPLWHSPNAKQLAPSIIPAGAAADVARLPEIMTHWYAEYNAKFEEWLDRMEEKAAMAESY